MYCIFSTQKRKQRHRRQRLNNSRTMWQWQWYTWVTSSPFVLRAQAWNKFVCSDQSPLHDLCLLLKLLFLCDGILVFLPQGLQFLLDVTKFSLDELQLLLTLKEVFLQSCHLDIQDIISVTLQSSVCVIIIWYTSLILHYLVPFGFYLLGNITVTNNSLNKLEHSWSSLTDGLHLFQARLEALQETYSR